MTIGKLSKTLSPRLKRTITTTLKKNNVVKAGLFGSYARGEAKKNSDIDLLIQFKDKKRTLFDLAGLELELEEKTGKKIDLLTYKSIHPLLKKIIHDEEVRLL